MGYQLGDTIVAVASAPGGGARGVIRISGSAALDIVTRSFTPAVDLSEVCHAAARRLRGTLGLAAAPGAPPQEMPASLLVWPGTRSYTREPAAELHTLGSPPLLAAIVEQLMSHGARAAQPGEFTLRAFLGGRIDLTQAEGVLGVIEARGREDLDAALDQVAGGMSRPLHELRERLMAALAELEAGLDFVDEDIEFITRDALRSNLEEARDVIEATISNLVAREVDADLPRVVITGLPNAGKSRLFNALVGGWGATNAAESIVSARPGATRDFVVALVDLDGVGCELVDTAGRTELERDPIERAAQQASRAQARQATVEMACIDATSANSDGVSQIASGAVEGLVVLTKTDLLQSPQEPATRAGYPNVLLCSSATGDGLVELVRELRKVLGDGVGGRASIASMTAVRCAGSLHAAAAAVATALELIHAGSEELVAAELRAALDALGEVVGAVCSEDILDRIFSQFCIGK